MRPKDYAFASLFYNEDKPFLHKLARKIKASVIQDDNLGIIHNPILSDNYHDVCQKKWDDHHPVLEIGNKTIQIEETSKADDLMTNSGLDQIIKLIIGTSAVRFTWMGKGTGVTAPDVTQTALVTEVSPRIDMTTSAGWIDPGGKSIGFAGIWGETHATITVNEQAVFSASSGGIMFNRNMFSNRPLTKTVSKGPMVLSSVMEVVPRA